MLQTIQSKPALFIGKSRSTDVDNGGILSLIMCGSEVSGPSVVMEAEGSGSVRDNIAVGKDDDQLCSKFQENGAKGVLHGGREFERSAFGNRAMLGRNLW